LWPDLDQAMARSIDIDELGYADLTIRNTSRILS
jgi:hypothetical protein